VRPRTYFSPSRRRRDRRKVFWIIVGSVAILAVVFLVFPTGLGPGGHSSQDLSTTTTTMSLSDIQSTYRAIYSEYGGALVSSNAMIEQGAADMATQERRLQNDITTYNDDETGKGCSGTPTYFASCLSNDQQTAQSALGDENAATRAKKADLTKQIRAVQQIENAITAFVGQLAGIPWPSSVSLAPLSLTHALSDSRSTYAQLAIDLASGKAISTDSQRIATAGSEVVAQLSNMASVLGIPPPSSPTPG
jgi:hypothetical protein